MARKRKCIGKDIMRIIGRAIKISCSFHSLITNPIKWGINKIGDTLIQRGKYPKIVGPIRNRIQIQFKNKKSLSIYSLYIFHQRMIHIKSSSS